MKRKGEVFAYIAGIIDSLGSIFIRQYKYQGLTNYTLALTIFHKRREVLESIQDFLKAEHISTSIYERERGYDLRFGGKASYEVLKRVMGYLTLKKPEAELGIKFYESRKRERPLSHEERERRRKFYETMKALKD